MKTRRPHFSDGEVFELTLDGDAPENQPLEMARRDGCGLQHVGNKIRGVQTRRFQWVAIGHCHHFGEVLEKLARHGKIPEGQWREAIKAQFQADGIYPRGIANASWTSPRFGGSFFPSVSSNGESEWHWFGPFGPLWRWLMQVE